MLRLCPFNSLRGGGEPLPKLRRRTLLTRTAQGALTLAAGPPVLALAGCGGKRLVPAHRVAEPPLVHYPMPYGTVSLTPGPTLERAYDEAALLAALQGIVNRDAPRLYVLGNPGPGSVADLDSFWWDRMGELGWSVAKQTPTVASSLSTLLAMFGHRTKGLVVWDPNVPATENVATTLAGVLDLLPVAYRTNSQADIHVLLIQNPTPLYTELLADGWGAAVSLVGPKGESLFTGKGTIPGTNIPSTGSPKNDAYLWAKALYLDKGRCSTDYMAYYIDAYWLSNPKAGTTFWNNTLVNHDYYVSKRAFCFDLDPWPDEAPVDDPQEKPGTDAATLSQLLFSVYHQNKGQKMVDVGGFPPWAFKYTNYGSAGGTHSPGDTEWRYAETLSGYNAFMEADALGYSSICNASFTQHFPLKQTYPQKAPPDTAELTKLGYLNADGSVKAAPYFAFYVGDFDSPAWLYHMLPELWSDQNRGKVPLSWAFDPNLCLRAGPAMAWARSTATPQDTFVAGDSGAGYLNPGGLETPRVSGLPSGMAAWAQHCKTFYTQWDLRVTGFIINGFSPPMRASGLDAYSGFSPGGTVGQGLPGGGALYNNMPVMAMDINGLGQSTAGAADTILPLFTFSGVPQFVVGRAVLQTPTWYLDVATRLSSGANGPAVTVVDLVTLMALLSIELGAKSGPHG